MACFSRPLVRFSPSNLYDFTKTIYRLNQNWLFHPLVWSSLDNISKKCIFTLAGSWKCESMMKQTKSMVNFYSMQGYGKWEICAVRHKPFELSWRSKCQVFWKKVKVEGLFSIKWVELWSISLCNSSTASQFSRLVSEE